MVTNNQTHGSAQTLSALCSALRPPPTILGDPQTVIAGLTDDSRKVQPGFLFAALRGTRADGHDPRFVRQAVEFGAAAILTEREDVHPDIARVYVTDTRRALAQAAARFYGLSGMLQSDRLRLFGVTGTNGKTTTCRLAQAVLNRGGRRCATLGTIEYDLLGRRTKAALTTPGAIELAQLVAEAAAHGADRVCMEVSSHALDQHRTDGLTFSAAVFTNLSGDHYDYHKNEAEYLKAKKRLFDELAASAVAIVNADDPAHERIVADCPARVLRFGMFDSAELRCTIRRTRSAGTDLTVHNGSHSWDLSVPLVGRHNALNVLAAIAVGLAEGISPQSAIEGVRSVAFVAGRLERVGDPECPIDVFVDYAHTDDALRNVLNAARQVCRGRLIVVFGCGGDRDTTKRPRMARAAADLADHIVITSDNPRTEDPLAIIEDIRRGLTPAECRAAAVEPDRGKAIELAIGRALPGDLVLIAGKGHEDYQIIGAERRWFDDRVVVSRVLEQVFGVPS